MASHGLLLVTGLEKSREPLLRADAWPEISVHLVSVQRVSMQPPRANVRLTNLRSGTVVVDRVLATPKPRQTSMRSPCKEQLQGYNRTARTMCRQRYDNRLRQSKLDRTCNGAQWHP